MAEANISNLTESGKTNGEVHIFTESEVTEYREGCEELGLKLSEAVDRIIKAGKKPTILIPSRGAVPIFLNALDFLRKGNDPTPLGNPETTYFFPDKIFQHLAPDVTKPGNPKEEPEKHVDVVLFPFTADVSVIDTDKVTSSLDTKKMNKAAEDLAEKLRKSCAKSIVSILYGEGDSIDLEWHYFLLGKLNPSAFNAFGSSAQEVIESLKSIKPDKEREIILIDTVLSGRAVSNIASAFKELDHPITPVFAVDNKDGRLQPRYQAEIRRNVNTDYVSDPRQQFTVFPLITEDRGPALLGVSAINIVNFNNPEYFKKLKTPGGEELPVDFLPQSCLWLVPPENGVSAGKLDYSDVFQAFMQLCMNGEYDGDMETFQKRLRYFLGKEGSKQPEFSKDILSGKLVSLVNTSSGIVSAYIDSKQARKWAEEFTKSL